MLLMIGSSISFATTRLFEKYSVYTYQLAKRRELFTNDKVLVNELMILPSPIVSTDESMDDVAKKFQQTSHYNLPVVDEGK